MRLPSLGFPDGFAWGAATSAYQIEGGINQDGRGPSIWDAFCAEPGRVRNGDSGAIAIDHRNRMREDVTLMSDLGLRAYRFSIAWPRVQPDGSGAVSASGLDFYRQLVDTLLEHNIEPFVTLYHWDLPLALGDRGGWTSRDTASRFGEYAAIAGNALGDRVQHWTTINEPWCAAMLGYAAGIHAPGVSDPAMAVRVAHHLLLGHGFATQALRASTSSASALSEISISLNPYPVVIAGDEPEDADAARRVDGVANRLWYDTVLRGAYPDDVLEDFSSVSDLTHIRDGDLAEIAQPLDALGINYYRRHHAVFQAGGSAKPPNNTWPGSNDIGVVEPYVPHTDGGWAIEPDGLVETLQRVRDEYPPIPLYVHENGASFIDGPDVNGTVQDAKRVAFFDAHLRAAHEAIISGVDLRGYFAWSFFDNFEWAEGYANRFGIVHVDFDTLVRTPKSSARFYADVIRTNGLDPHER